MTDPAVHLVITHTTRAYCGRPRTRTRQAVLYVGDWTLDRVTCAVCISGFQAQRQRGSHPAAEG